VAIPEQLSFINNKEKNGFSDPSFATNKERPVHRWVPWIAGFSSEFVREAVDRHISGSGVVIDPFAGVGTTLVESMLAGHRAIGFEINPYAALACQVKTSAQHLEVARLRKALESLAEFHRRTKTMEYLPKSTPPQGFHSRSPFYSPAVLHKVLVYLDFVYTLDDENTADLFRLAFASTMVRYSNYSYEPSLGRRVSAGKEEIDDYPVIEAIQAKLQEMTLDIEWMQKTMPRTDVPSKVINRSFFECKSYVDPGVADLLVTSPPYLNNYHYNRNTRPHLYWLGFVQKPSDMKPLEQMNFGKFWQTVRDLERLDLAFSLPSSDLETTLEHLRTLHPEKGVYGGNGWANYAAAYLNDCRRFSDGIG